MCVLPGGECSCKRRSGNTLGGRSSPRRWVSPSRTPAWSRSGRCRCRPTREGSPYAPHTERKKASIGLDFWKILSSKLLGPFSSKRHLRRGRKRTPKQKHTYQEQTARLQHKETVKAAKLVTITEVLLLIAVKLLKQYMKVFRDTQYNFVQESITRIKNKTTTSSSQEQSGYLFSGDITGL